jgi:hypothetical protein
MFVPLPRDPVSQGIGIDGTPNRFYVGDVWVYIWLVKQQFDIQQNQCIYCKSTEHVESQGLRFRSMFWWDKIAWVLYRRLRCKNACFPPSSRGTYRSFSTIDTRYLSLLPTKVAERCEFVGTAGGLGMHTSMVDAFSNLMTKQNLFGAFSKLINELQHIRYSKMHLSYLDSLIDWDP